MDLLWILFIIIDAHTAYGENAINIKGALVFSVCVDQNNKRLTRTQLELICILCGSLPPDWLQKVLNALLCMCHTAKSGGNTLMIIINMKIYWNHTSDTSGTSSKYLNIYNEVTWSPLITFKRQVEIYMLIGYPNYFWKKYSARMRNNLLIYISLKMAL